MKDFLLQKYFLKTVLLLGWIAGCFPVKRPLGPQREFKTFSLISLFSWTVFFFNFGFSTDYMIKLFSKEFKSQKLSDFILIYGVLILYYGVDLVTRLISLLVCGKLIHVLNFIDGEKLTSEPKPAFSFIFVLFTFGVTISKRVVEAFVYYSEEYSIWGSGNGMLSIISSFLCDIFLNLRGVYVFTITMAVGMELIQCYEHLCTEFKATCPHLNGSLTKISATKQSNHRFVKLQKMFDIYQNTGGDYGLIIIINSAFDFVYYVYSFVKLLRDFGSSARSPVFCFTWK
jgi:hypothetical protein